MWVTVVGVLLASAASLAEAKIVGAYVIPHGGSALDPESFAARDQAAREAARALHTCALAAGDDIVALKPDLIYLSSPHGISHHRDVSILANDAAEGFAPTDADDYGVTLSVKLDAQVAKAVADELAAGGARNVSMISAYSATEKAPIRWGEVIPLWFARSALAAGARVVIATQPFRRQEGAASMIPEMLELGGALYDALERLPQRVVVLVSCDLAHTHDPNGPYGYSDAAQPFDDAVAKWAREGDRAALVVAARKLADEALSCGYTGLAVLQGVVDASPGEWKSSVCAVSHPQYYGMMVAPFVRRA